MITGSYLKHWLAHLHLRYIETRISPISSPGFQ